MSGRETWKRPFDLVLLLLALVLLAPLWLALGLAIVLAIRLDDGGPALFRQARLGRGGRVFEILKFRTMPVDAEERFGPQWAAWNDRRATRVGRVLRRFHLDELPQAVNVLKGEMSLVGPRPERPGRAERITRSVPGFAERLAVRPGIAGLAQARGGHDVGPRDKLRYDRLYIEAMSPWLDLKLSVTCLARALRASPSPAGRGRASRAARRPVASDQDSAGVHGSRTGG
ncbi:MAG: sugar transferase [Holophagales bacterium]|nr:sugar transferase [Holophagales bacterium]